MLKSAPASLEHMATPLWSPGYVAAQTAARDATKNARMTLPPDIDSIKARIAQGEQAADAPGLLIADR